MTTQWYVAIEGEQKGPLTDADIQRWVSERKIHPDTFVRAGIDGDWNPASEVPGLYSQPVARPKSIARRSHPAQITWWELLFPVVVVAVVLLLLLCSVWPLERVIAFIAPLLLLLLFVAIAVFWLVMLIDCLKSQRSDKVVWALLHLFLFALGAILYFFMAYGKQEGKKR